MTEGTLPPPPGQGERPGPPAMSLAAPGAPALESPGVPVLLHHEGATGARAAGGCALSRSAGAPS